MVMRSLHRVMHVHHWLRSHWLGARWSTRCCVLCERISCETDRESGGCDKALNHRNVPEDPNGPDQQLREASLVPTLMKVKSHKFALQE
jgi:hypothetical protein